MPRYLKRQRILINEVSRKIKDNNYKIGDSEEGSFLFPRDKQKAEKLFLQSKLSKDKVTFINKLKDSQKGQELLIELFIKNKVEKVISIEEIDKELISGLFTYLEGNRSDANILASGIQEHNKKEVILITGDKEHWTKDNLEWSISPASNLAKKYPKIPQIKYIQNL